MLNEFRPIDMAPFTPSDEEYKSGMRCKNAVQCTICQSNADRFLHGLQCQKFPGHMADLVTGLFTDLTFSERSYHDCAQSKPSTDS